MHSSFRAGFPSLAVALAFAAMMPGQAQAQANLTGEWVLSVDASDAGQSPLPDSAFLSIEKAGEDLVMTGVRYFAAPHGARSTWFDMPIDGEVHKVRTDDGEFDSTATWEDDALAIWRLAESNVGEVELNERLSLKDDGKTLVRSIDIEVPGMGEAYQVMEYARKE